MKRFGVAVLTLAVVFSAVAVQAQPGVGQRGGFQPGGAFGQQGNILRVIQVFEEELEVTPQERMEVQTIVRQARPEGGFDRQALQGLDRAEMMARMEERQAQMQEQQQQVLDEVKKVLGPERGARLEQLVLQAQGARALLNPAVAEKVGLSDEKRAEIAAALRGGPMRPGEGDIRQAMAEREQAALALLSAEERAKYDEVRGELVPDIQERLRPAGRGPGAGERPQFQRGGEGGRPQGQRGGEGGRQRRGGPTI